jgi:Zn-dependent peptidase ImmA (M78 family)/transcriptional regulator with XRE-family HTH domain
MRYEGPSYAIGTKCRELRARYNLTMGDQARGLDISVAYISAIERGKRPVPEDYPSKLSEWMSLPHEDSRVLREIASGERTVVKVFPKNRERALLAEDFARDLNGLSPESVKQLREVLQSSKCSKYSDDELRKRAYMARAVFLGFDILRIVENQLPAIDPDFSLQIDPDGSLGEYLQVYSDSDGKSINRFVLTEWLYNAADKGTDDSRFKLAHELAHWILHRTVSHAFLRSPRTNKVLTKVHAVVEREADFFAREFLMPLVVVEKFNSPEALAKAAQVPLWLAKVRLREVSTLTQTDRENIRRLTVAAEVATRPASGSTNSVAPALRETAPTARAPSAAILQFPKASVLPRLSNKKVETKSASLPLFDYAEAKQRFDSDARVVRSDQWFADYGWRG